MPPPRAQRRGRRCHPLAPAALALLAAGCTLALRPTPGAPRNVFCALEYRPDAASSRPDVLFLAGAWPYRTEEAYMSLPDGVVHGLFAPGRHLSRPVHLEGVTCEPPLWPKGHRLSQSLRLRRALVCRRNDLERLVIEVDTRWGSCRQEIPAGDARPRCRLWFGRTSKSLERLSPTVCPRLPEPSADSRRGTTAGVHWIVVTEGDGVPAGPGAALRVHETFVTRRGEVAASSHFDGEPRRVLLGGPPHPDRLPSAIAAALVGMRVGEQRRLFHFWYAGLAGPQQAQTLRGVPPEDLHFYDVELVAIQDPSGLPAQHHPPE